MENRFLLTTRVTASIPLQRILNYMMKYNLNIQERSYIAMAIKTETPLDHLQRERDVPSTREELRARLNEKAFIEPL